MIEHLYKYEIGTVVRFRIRGRQHRTGTVVGRYERTTVHPIYEVAVGVKVPGRHVPVHRVFEDEIVEEITS